MDDPPNPTLSEKARLSGARPLRIQDRVRADDSPHDQAPSELSRRAVDPIQDPVPSNKSKSSGTVHRPSNFPPEFYDKLSRVWPTRRALRELDRRNKNLPLSKPTARPRLPRSSKVATLAKQFGSNLSSVAAAGGLDLSDLRGYQSPTSSAMASPSVSSSSSQKTRSTKATTLSSKSKRSSAYDANFEQHCIDYQIYPPFHKFADGRRPLKPANLDEIQQALRVPRGSLSPSVVPETAFEDFQIKNTTKSEGAMMRSVVPIVTGDLDIPNEGHLPFTNLELMTENTTAIPVPDFFDGVLPGAVDRQVREDLNKIIVPTKHANTPIAANLFLEAKGPAGTGDVAKGQAIQDGATGTRLIFALQNYRLKTPIYDGNAYTFSATLVDGQVKLNAHHLTAPAIPGQRPEYWTTQLKAYALTSDDEVWSEGIGAFRNMRVLAKGYRDRFINIANTRAREQNQDTLTTEEHDQASSPADYFDCLPFAPSHDSDEETQGTDAGFAIETKRTMQKI